MKFGKTLLKSQVQEWAWNYISYKSLKHNVTNILNAQKRNVSAESVEDLVTAFFFTLDRELEKSELERRLRILMEKYRTVSSMPVVTQTPSIPSTTLMTMQSGDSSLENALLAALYDTKENIHKILRFGELNTNGFRKILKKFDKKVSRQTQETYMKKVLILPFANTSGFDESLDRLDETIAGVQGRINEYKSKSAEQLQNQAVQETDKSLLNKENKEKLVAILTEDQVDDLKAFIYSLEFYQSPLKHSMTGLGFFGSEDEAAQKSKINASLRFLTNTLYKACKFGALKCLKFVLAEGAEVNGANDVDERSFLHKLVLAGGNLEEIHRLADGTYINRFTDERTPLSIAATTRSIVSKNQEESAEVVKSLLKEFEAIRLSLLSLDIYGRIPLHYAALNGNAKIAAALVEAKKSTEPYGTSWVDHEGHSPFFYAVFRGFTDIVKVLLTVENVRVDHLFLDTSVVDPPKSVVVLSAIPASSPVFTQQQQQFSLQENTAQTPLSIACKLGHFELARLLVSHGANVDFRDEDGETPLHMCCRNGHLECVKLLLDSTLKHCASLEIKEKLYGWTPIFLAVVEGHFEIVQLLLENGANADLMDFNGWTPHEHAIFRGNLEIAKMLKPKTMIKSPLNSTETTPHLSPNSPNKSDILMNPDRSYGHNYLQDEYMIIINLGSKDIRRKLNPLQLFEDTIPAYPSLSLVVSAINATGESAVLDLPLTAFEPLIFHAKKDGNQVCLRFDLIPTFGTHKQIIGRATGLLSSFETFQTVSLPLVGHTHFDLVGILHLELTIVHPFKHKNLSIGSKQTYWKSVETKVIGHRGAGANRSFSAGTGASLQIGENTVLSFVTAASLGAEYVEFDVQLTKDNVPVIYHDWALSETGLNVSVFDVTADEFQSLGPRTQRRRSFKQLNKLKDKSSTYIDNNEKDRGSVSDDDDYTLKQISKDFNHLHTTAASVDDKKKMRKRHYGGRADISIKAPFATLEELFHKVPETTGFNIEVKYPNLQEIERNYLKPPDLNLMIDQILKCVYDNAGERSIIFSSFHPEACLLLNLKQPNFPVFFLTEGGVEKTYDLRCNSLQESIRFAKFADLLGIVTLSDPLIEAPYLCKAIKENGLLLFSYGPLNNDVKCFALQRKFGVDAVIVDKILPIVGSLKLQE